MKIRLLTVAIASLLLQGCIKEKYDLNKVHGTYDPSVAAPLINSTITAEDILVKADPNDEVQSEQDGLMFLIYDSETFSVNIGDLAQFPNQTYNNNIAIGPAQAASLNSGTPVNISAPTQTLSFTPTGTAGNIDLDEIKFKSGDLEFTINNNVPKNATVTISIPELRDAFGASFSEVVNVNASQNSNVVYPLDNYVADLTNGGTTVNELDVDYSVNFAAGAGVASGGDDIDFTQEFNNIEYYHVVGDFGNQNIDVLKDTILVSVFDNEANGFFQLTDTRLKLTFNNSLGLPLNVSIDTLQSQNLNTGTLTDILYTTFVNPFGINYPSLANIGTSETYIDSIYKDNSLISDIITPAPKNVIYKITAETNPTGSTPVSRNFITDSSRIDVEAELKLPLVGFAHSWSFEDTVAIDLSGETDNDIEEIQRVLLRLNIDNGFPFNARLQVYLTDSNQVVLDSLMTNGVESLINGGQINGNGIVIAPTNKITDITIERAQVPNIFNAKYAIIKAYGETNNAGPSAANPEVKIYDYYTFKVRAGAKVDTQIEF